ncbi:MAG: hypothetical protein RBG13Loki_1468 [Promethearchaeota archaeon CR_4]|nr:MAG: hypothetical protein RBG13Loki_1468 [Candidatus Lokiarchaeota archaeon CR_4]
MPQGEIARQLKASFQKFYLAIYPYIRWEKLGFSLRDGKPDPNWKPNVINLDIQHTVFKALLREAETTPQAGTYKIRKKSFNIMLFDTGKIIFYASDLPENVARAFLYWLTTPPPVGVGLTRVQALYLMSVLELFSLEGESPVIGDPYDILPNARIGVTEFDPVPYFGPATIEHFVDKSKYKKEIGTRGSPREATDFQEMIAKPDRVEGWIRRIPPAIVGLGEKVNELIRTYNQNMQLTIQMNEVHSDNERHLKRHLRTLGKDLGQHILFHQESLEEQKTTNKLLGESNDLHREQIDATREGAEETKRKVEQSSGETQEILREMMELQENYALRLQIYGEGLLQGQWEIKQQNKQHDLQEQIRWTTMLQEVRDLKQKIEGLHKGLVFKAKSFLQRWQELIDQLEKIHLEIDGLYQIRDGMRQIYAKILAILEQIPELTAAQLAAIFNVKPNKMHYWLTRLGSGTEKIKGMRFLDREKKTPIHDQEKTIPQSEIPDYHAKQQRIWKVFHYFLNKFRNYTINNKKFKQDVNGGEIVGSKRI